MQPITNWDLVKKGEKIFFKGSNHPSYYDEFIGIHEPNDRHLVEYKSVNGDSGIYLLGSEGWYYWNQDIANEIITEISYDPYNHFE